MIGVSQIFLPGFVIEGNDLSGLAFLKEIIPVDGYLREAHRYSRVRTKYPIQSKGAITDFSKRMQPQLELHCIVADCVVERWNSISGILNSYPGRKDELKDKILDLHESDYLFSINTTMGIYDDCQFDNLNFDIEPENEDTIEFTASVGVNWFADIGNTDNTEELNLADDLKSIVGPVVNLGRTTPRKLGIL